MTRFLLSFALATLSMLAPVGVLAASYRFDIPLTLTQIGPAAAHLTLFCEIFPGIAHSGDSLAKSSVVFITLNNSGGFRGTATAVVNTNLPVPASATYFCFFDPTMTLGGNPTGVPLPGVLTTGISGKLQ